MEPEQKTNGALIGSIVIIVILVIGVIYLLKNSLQETNTDSADEIEANLNSMEFDSLDNGI